LVGEEVDVAGGVDGVRDAVDGVGCWRASTEERGVFDVIHPVSLTKSTWPSVPALDPYFDDILAQLESGLPLLASSLPSILPPPSSLSRLSVLPMRKRIDSQQTTRMQHLHDLPDDLQVF
jgi:hypothetical protein